MHVRGLQHEERRDFRRHAAIQSTSRSVIADLRASVSGRVRLPLELLLQLGVPHLIFSLSLQAILTSSMEMIKQPKNLLLTVACLGGSLVLVDLLISMSATQLKCRDRRGHPE
jgi:hypothetical protein